MGRLWTDNVHLLPHVPLLSLQYFAAVYIGLGTAIFWTLMINGFVGFQLWEDGTPKSLWFLRISSLALFALGFVISLATFISIGSLSPTNTVGLWIVQLLFPVICIAIYVISQVILVLRTLDDRWPLGDILFGVLAFVAACVLMFGVSSQICSGVKHYLDGTFFGVLCLLLAVMMVYKYWDSITREDLEFSVGSKQAAWEVKDSSMGNSDTDVITATGSSVTHESGQTAGGYGGKGRDNGRLAPYPGGANGKGGQASGGYPPSGYSGNF